MELHIQRVSKPQVLSVLGFAEFGFYATREASAGTSRITSVLHGYGVDVAGEMWEDVRAAFGITNRKGLGKTRDIQFGLLWVQQVAAENITVRQSVWQGGRSISLHIMWIGRP